MKSGQCIVRGLSELAHNPDAVEVDPLWRVSLDLLPDNP